MTIFHIKQPIVFLVMSVLILAVSVAGCGSREDSSNKEMNPIGAAADLGAQEKPLWEAIPSKEEGESLGRAEEADTDLDRIDRDKEQNRGISEPADPSEVKLGETDTDKMSGYIPEEEYSKEAILELEETMKEALVAVMEERGLNSNNFSAACMDLRSGATCYFNELKMWDACSTYKFPLSMLYLDMERDGEITPDDIIPGTDRTLEDCMHQSLEFSNNELSEAMMDNLGDYYIVKHDLCRYFTQTEEETDPDYYTHNYYCARMMMDLSAYLYANRDDYKEAWKYLSAAQPGMYFKKYIREEIAQKYGRREDYEHCVGIIMGERPMALAIYSENAGGENMIGACAARLYEAVAAFDSQ